MFKSKKVSIVIIVAVLFVGIGVGLMMARSSTPVANADNTQTGTHVDAATLDQIYQAAFGRPVDAEGKSFHLGQDINQLLRDINNSGERKYYSALNKSVKAYEQALRAPGTLSDADKQAYLNNINAALATLIAWVETLPKQDICQGVVGADDARQAIQDAYNGMTAAAQAIARQGLFKALDQLGSPGEQHLPMFRCMTSPTPTPTASPSPTPTP